MAIRPVAQIHARGEESSQPPMDCPPHCRPPRPWHFFFLVLPYGVSFGFVSGALPYIARQQGVGVVAIGEVVAAAFAPHALKFLWAPIVDVTWSRKGWYSLSLAL